MNAAAQAGLWEEAVLNGSGTWGTPNGCRSGVAEGATVGRGTAGAQQTQQCWTTRRSREEVTEAKGAHWEITSEGADGVGAEERPLVFAWGGFLAGLGALSGPDASTRLDPRRLCHSPDRRGSRALRLELAARRPSLPFIPPQFVQVAAQRPPLSLPCCCYRGVLASTSTVDTFTYHRFRISPVGARTRRLSHPRQRASNSPSRVGPTAS